jgi:phosphatidylglycerophosphatase A
MRNIVLLTSTAAGAGYLPRFPGTFATCLAVPFSFALNHLAIYTPYGALFLLIGFTAGAIWLSGRAAAMLARKDPQVIVIDEITGFLVANFFNQQKLASVILAFILFRFFDIAKVFPAGKAEKLPGGFGIVLDDVIAGIYTFVILHVLTRGGFV